MDKYEPDNESDSRIKAFLYVVGILIFLVLMWMMAAGCATSSGIDWQRVIAAIQEYKDDIPYEEIQDALNKIKEK